MTICLDLAQARYYDLQALLIAYLSREAHARGQDHLRGVSRRIAEGSPYNDCIREVQAVFLDPSSD